MSRRAFYTFVEASALLADVRASIRDVALGAAATSVVDDTLLSYRGDLFLDDDDGTVFQGQGRATTTEASSHG